MANNEKTRVQVETLKMYGSPNYRKKIKRLTESFKALREMTGTRLRGIQSQLKATATDLEREASAKQFAYSLDRSTARYFTQYAAFSSERRVKSGAPKEEK